MEGLHQGLVGGAKKGHMSFLSGDPAALLALLNETHDVISVLGADGRQKWFSNAFVRVFGYTTPPGSFPAEFVHPEDRQRVYDLFQWFVSSGAFETSAEYRVRHADGSWRWVEVTARNRLDDPMIAGIVSITRDVTARKEAEEQLRHLAGHDPLTGLPNRAQLVASIEMALQGGGPARPVVFFVDLDGFKAVNDRFGHDMGDRVLQVVAARMAAAVRGGELVARYGGDEFVIVASLPPDGRSEEALAARIQAALAAPVDLDGHWVSVGASVGWCVAADGDTASDLIRGADRAAYDAKARRGVQRPADASERPG